MRISGYIFFRICYLWFLASICCDGLIAQSPGDVIIENQIDERYLGGLVKYNVDSLRVAHGLPVLRNHPILYAAAERHVRYMDSLNQIGHFEDEYPQLYSPSDRVMFYGGNTFIGVGENCLYTFIGKPFTSKDHNRQQRVTTSRTYKDVAYAMVCAWFNSSRHYQNMITPGYEFGAVAVRFNPANGRVYACQVFASSFGYVIYTQAENSVYPLMSPITPKVVSGFDQVDSIPHSLVHAWRLQVHDSFRTKSSIEGSSFANGTTTRIQVIDGKIVFRTSDTELMKVLLDDRTDGLAAEIVYFKHSDCGNSQYYTKPSRRNGQCIFSGQVLKPLYKKKLASAFKRKKRLSFGEILDSTLFNNGLQLEDTRFKSLVRLVKNPYESSYFEVVLGKVPKDSKGYYEVNVVCIQKKKVYAIWHFTNYCGEPLTYSLTPLTFQYQEGQLIQLPDRLVERTFVVPFEKNKYDYLTNEIQPLLDSMSFSFFAIDSIIVEAYSSVEGDESINKELQEKRAQGIVKAIREMRMDSFAIRIESTENWAMFDVQVTGNAELQRYRNKSHEEIKIILQDTAEQQRIESFLKAQRYARVTLKVRYPETFQHSKEWWLSKYKIWVDSATDSKSYSLYLDSLRNLQFTHIVLLQHGVADTNSFVDVKFPDSELFQELIWKRLTTIYSLNLMDMDSVSRDAWMFEAALAYYNRFPNLHTAEPAITLIHLQLKYPIEQHPFSSFDPQRLIQWFAEAEKLQPIDISYRYAFSICATEYYMNKGSKYLRLQDQYAINVMTIYPFVQSSDTTQLKLAKFLVYYGYVSLAEYVLSNTLKDSVYNIESVKLLANLRYTYPEPFADTTSYASFYSLLLWAKSKLPLNDWCDLITGPCRMSYQWFDDEKSRKLYCDSCSGYPIYARDAYRKQ